MKRIAGCFTFVLHAHLPYVLGHGGWPHGMDWLYECAAETYLPLLETLTRLANEGHPPKLTLGITPVLAEQFADDRFKHGFDGYLESKAESARANRSEFESRSDHEMAALAARWEKFFTGAGERFRSTYGRDLIGAFRSLQDGGQIEIITSAATHGYFPLLGQDTSIQAQVKQGVAAHRRHFGRQPAGFWLPECGYRPRYRWRSPVAGAGPSQPYLRKGVEEFLGESGLDFFVIDTPLLKGGEAIGVYLDRFQSLRELWERFSQSYQPVTEQQDKSPYQPHLASSAPEASRPIAFFTRDPATGIQVWSGEHGYPGDPWYLDFHKKHYPGGHRYWRVTSAKSDLGSKEIYRPEMAQSRLPENAGHFKQLMKDLLLSHRQSNGRPGILCAPYDAELFGHWWFEGPEWLYLVLKSASQDPELRLTTCSEYLAENPPSQVVSLPEGSWGQGNFHWIWLNDWTTWTWQRIYPAEEEMSRLAGEFPHSQGRLRELIQQAGRELLLLESSDWQFLISTWSARDYAELRAVDHHESFRRLADMARRSGRGEQLGQEEWDFLARCQDRDRLFPDLEPEWFAQVEHPPQEG